MTETETDYAVMTNAALNEAAAVLIMKWEVGLNRNSGASGYFKDGYRFVERSSFRPSTDYNAAALLRSEIERRGLESQFMVAIVLIADDKTKFNTSWCIADASPRQITEACCRAVEGAG